MHHPHRFWKRRLETWFSAVLWAGTIASLLSGCGRFEARAIHPVDARARDTADALTFAAEATPADRPKLEIADGLDDVPPDVADLDTTLAIVDAQVVEASPGDATLESGQETAVELVGAPLVFNPTPHNFTINAVLRSGFPSALRLRVRDESSLDWTDIGSPTSPAPDIAQWPVTGLAPGRRYDYEILPAAAMDGGPDQQTPQAIYAGSAVTAREPGAAFTFALLSDTHIQPRDPIPAGDAVGTDFFGFDEATLQSVAKDMAASSPDFFINLGDMLDYHLFGFNQPPPDRSWARLAYLNYRRLFGDTLGHAAHFPVIGNWDGEDGFFSEEERQRSSSQRMTYLPGPTPDTYPQGGSASEDYYAFTWGDALFIVLNVMTYTPTQHLLGMDPGLPDDWTLGPDQRAWLDRTLATATSKWRFLFIHHTVGGAAGNDIDSAYGRGGGQAARVGEQSAIHDMMLKYGVQIFFYGHDHVFTDMAVDGIHYTLPGSAGAPWKFDTSVTGYANYWPDSGYARVKVSQDRVQVDFIAVGGKVLMGYTLQ